MRNMILDNHCGNNLEDSLKQKNNNELDNNNNHQYDLFESLEDLFSNVLSRNIGQLGYSHNTMPVHHDRSGTYKRYVHSSCCNAALWSTVMGYYVAAMVSTTINLFKFCNMVISPWNVTFCGNKLFIRY